mgnify:CR=1 FL=1
MNYNAGVKTPMANIVMSMMVLVVLAVATPLFHDTPNCILASIIINAVLGLLDYSAMYKIWKIDFGDFVAMVGAFFGVIFISVEMGLLIAVYCKDSAITNYDPDLLFSNVRIQFFNVGCPLSSKNLVTSDQAPYSCVGKNSRDKYLQECGAIPRFHQTAGYLGYPNRCCYLLLQFQLSERKV